MHAVANNYEQSIGEINLTRVTTSSLCCLQTEAAIIGCAKQLQLKQFRSSLTASAFFPHSHARFQKPRDLVANRCSCRPDRGLICSANTESILILRILHQYKYSVCISDNCNGRHSKIFRILTI